MKSIRGACVFGAGVLPRVRRVSIEMGGTVVFSVTGWATEKGGDASSFNLDDATGWLFFRWKKDTMLL
jgi:hypothetical protein